jgi:hypothetical protein
MTREQVRIASHLATLRKTGDGAVDAGEERRHMNIAGMNRDPDRR